MQSHARAAVMIIVGLLLRTLDQIAWSLCGILTLGTCVFHVLSWIRFMLWSSQFCRPFQLSHVMCVVI